MEENANKTKEQSGPAPPPLSSVAADSSNNGKNQSAAAAEANSAPSAQKQLEFDGFKYKVMPDGQWLMLHQLPLQYHTEALRLALLESAEAVELQQLILRTAYEATHSPETRSELQRMHPDLPFVPHTNDHGFHPGKKVRATFVKHGTRSTEWQPGVHPAQLRFEIMDKDIMKHHFVLHKRNDMTNISSQYQPEAEELQESKIPKELGAATRNTNSVLPQGGRMPFNDRIEPIQRPNAQVDLLETRPLIKCHSRTGLSPNTIVLGSEVEAILKRVRSPPAPYYMTRKINPKHDDEDNWVNGKDPLDPREEVTRLNSQGKIEKVKLNIQTSQSATMKFYNGPTVFTAEGMEVSVFANPYNRIRWDGKCLWYMGYNPEGWFQVPWCVRLGDSALGAILMSGAPMVWLAEMYPYDFDSERSQVFHDRVPVGTAWRPLAFRDVLFTAWLDFSLTVCGSCITL